MCSYVLLPSEFGTFSIVWRVIEGRPRVLRVFLPDPEASPLDLTQAAFPGASPRSTPHIQNLAQRMGRFLEGQAVNFHLGILALERCSEFQVRVLRAEYRIPRGWVSTYGRIARHLGMSRGARAVGGALARNPFPIVIPCHRAIRSDGRLGGFQGGLEMKRALLELEGVEISPAGRVLTERFHY
ncbi:MAG: methylated-DNA--[protein]-cysteine S-methyltransferase [Chloroflexota bacterium]